MVPICFCWIHISLLSNQYIHDVSNRRFPFFYGQGPQERSASLTTKLQEQNCTPLAPYTWIIEAKLCLENRWPNRSEWSVDIFRLYTIHIYIYIYFVINANRLKVPPVSIKESLLWTFSTNSFQINLGVFFIIQWKYRGSA